MRHDLECVGLAGKAGGLRTAALVLRSLHAKGTNVSLEWIADQFDRKADDCHAQALAHMPFSVSEQQ